MPMFLNHSSSRLQEFLCSAPTDSSSTPKTLVWLRLFWRERYWFLFFLLCVFLSHRVRKWLFKFFFCISIMFQTVAECVLFYYLTKKNENYKNIVRRNYRRRGRSQVFSPFFFFKLIVQKDALLYITTRFVGLKITPPSFLRRAAHAGGLEIFCYC